MQRQAKSEAGNDRWIIRYGSERRGSAKREPGGKNGQGKLVTEPVKRCEKVRGFSTPIVNAFAEADTAEVEAKRRPAEIAEDTRGMIDDLVVHGATAERVGMR